MGSGSTAVGALRQSCEYIGFDIDTDYIDFAEHRIKVLTEELNSPSNLLFDNHS